MDFYAHICTKRSLPSECILQPFQTFAFAVHISHLNLRWKVSIHQSVSAFSKVHFSILLDWRQEGHPDSRKPCSTLQNPANSKVSAWRNKTWQRNQLSIRRNGKSSIQLVNTVGAFNKPGKFSLKRLGGRKGIAACKNQHSNCSHRFYFEISRKKIKQQDKQLIHVHHETACYDGIAVICLSASVYVCPMTLS